MLVVHATRKLLDRVGQSTVDPDTDPFIAGELAEATQVGLARTNNRSVLGVMNEFVRLADWQKSTIGTESDLIDLALELSEVPTSPLYKRNISPKHELTAVVAEMR